MGIRNPDLPGWDMSIEIRSDTPAEAPPVRKMCSGYAGCPPRATRGKPRPGGKYNAANRCEEEHRPWIKFCDVLADEWDTLGLGICADRANFFP